MDADRNESHTGRAARVGLHTALVDNSTAFGFSITITASYGALNQLAGSPALLHITGFAVGAALAFTLLQAAVSRGFRRRPGKAPREVVLLGTALDVVSVALGLGAAMLAGLLLPPAVAWPVGAFAAAAVFALSQAVELMVAVRLEHELGDPEAEREEQ